MSSTVHTVTTPDNISLLVQLLQHHSPHGLALLRRLQCPVQSSQTLVLSTFPPSILASPPTAVSAVPDPYAIAFFDRTTPDCLPCFLFSSIQLPTNDASDASRTETATRQILELLAFCHRERPKFPHDASAQFSTTETGGAAKHELLARDADISFIGCLHTRTAELLRTHRLIQQPGHKVALDDVFGPGGPYVKLVWRSHASQVPKALANGNEHDESPKNDPADETLPDGLIWDHVTTDEDFATVIANNNLVRLRSQIEGRPNVALRHVSSQQLVGFVYLGLDSSVKTLFVSASYRRQGLARKLIRKLVKEHGAEDGWCHSDAAPDNTQSRGLLENSFGARPAQESYWMRVDLAAADKIVQGLATKETPEQDGKKEKVWKWSFDFSLG